MRKNSAAAAHRLLAAGFQPMRDRDSCARCRFSEVEDDGKDKSYYCTTKDAWVPGGGHCRDFVGMDTAQHQLPFVQTVMQEISSAVGHASAFQLCRRWGGRELRVPVAIEDGHPLALALGMAAAQRLVRTFGGQRLDLPLDVNVMRAKRDAAIIADIERGMSEELCGVTYGLTRQAVRAIYAKRERLEEA